jgi:ubiquinone/menaquinone biosynthesis C-methylase UbiE
MDTKLQHGMDIPQNLGSRARARFVSGLRSYVLNNMASELRQDYEANVEPKWLESEGEQPANGWEVLKAIRGSEYFKQYSSLRCATQELVWDTVIDSVENNVERLQENFEKFSADQSQAQGTLSLNPDLEIPRYADAVDVHLMPGNYGGVDAAIEPGAIYDHGLNVFAFGMMGKQLNDIGWSMANFFRLKFPDIQPQRIVDVGCTIGHNTVPWKQTFPDAEVHGIDIAAPCLSYAHARAQSMGISIHFHQGRAESLDFEDASVDVVFSSMLLHELPEDVIDAFFAEAFRVLKPGGVLINMELPPNDSLSPYDAFYLDWDCYYNNEPFYKSFRDQSYSGLCSKAGFSEESFFEAVMPRFTYVDEDVFKQSVAGPAEFNEDTGRLSDGIMWYGFGARKSAAPGV